MKTSRTTVAWAVISLLLPLLFWWLYSIPGWGQPGHPVLETTAFRQVFIAHNRIYLLACLVALETALWVIAWQRGFFTRHFRLFTGLLTGAGLAFLLYFAFNRDFDTDELEHFHSAWNMMQGKAPYVDFFQHHHPLLWLQNMGPIYIWGDTFATLQAGRGVNFIFLAGILALVFALAREVTGSKFTGLLAVFLLVCFPYFVEAAIENRPDNPQTFFFLLAFYGMLRYWRRPVFGYLAGSGLALGLAFLYLQKVVLLFPALGLVTVFFLLRKKMTWTHLSGFIAAFCIPVLVFAGYFLGKGHWEDYLLFAWVINLHKSEPGHFWRYFLHILVFGPWFLILLGMALMHWIRHFSALDLRLKMVIFTGLLSGLIMCSTPNPWKQYFLPVWPLLSVGVAYVTAEYLRRFRPHVRLIFLTALLGLSSGALMMERLVRSNNATRDALALAGELTEPGDVVFDEYILFNVFRSDLHFFWFSTYLGGKYGAYLRVLENPDYQGLLHWPHDDFNFCALLEERKPRLVFMRQDSANRLEKCPLAAGRYSPVEGYAGLYERKRD